MRDANWLLHLLYGGGAASSDSINREPALPLIGRRTYWAFLRVANSCSFSFETPEHMLELAHGIARLAFDSYRDNQSGIYPNFVALIPQRLDFEVVFFQFLNVIAAREIDIPIPIKLRATFEDFKHGFSGTIVLLRPMPIFRQRPIAATAYIQVS